MTGRILRQHGTTVGLLVLVLAAATVVLWVDRGAVTTSEAEQRKKSLFEAFRIDDITELDVTIDGRTARVLRAAVNDAGQRDWEVLLDGARYPAEEQVVDQYLGALDLAVVERRVPPASVDRARFGLAAPRITARVVMGRFDYRLRIGGPAPSPSGAVYAEVEGHGAFVVTQQLAAALDVRPDAFRARAFVPYAPDEIQAISLDGEGGVRPLVRVGPGAARGAGFRFDGTTKEGSVRVSAAALEKIWIALGALDADAFLADADADRAQDRKVTLTLSPRDPAKKRAVIELGGACAGHPDDILAIQREPTRVSACVPQGALAGLTGPSAELVDRRLLGAPADEVTEVKLTAEGRAVELARKGPQWHMRAPVDRSVDAETGRAFLDTLLSVEAAHLIAAADLKVLGLDPPRAKVRLISVTPSGGADGGDEEREETLLVGDEQGDVVHVRRLEDAAIAAVPKERARILFPSELALRSRQLFDEPAESVRALRIEGGGRVQRLARGKGSGFSLLEPSGEGLTADDRLAADLAQAFGALSVERWVEDKSADAGAYGLDKPRLLIEAEVGEGREGADAGGRKTLKLAIGAPAGAGSFARAGSDPAVFVVSGALEAAADRWLLQRGATQIDPESIQRATLRAEGGKTVVIEQSDGVFRLAGVAADPVSTAKAAAIRDALGDLVAEGAVSIGKADRSQGLDPPRLEITALPAGVTGGKPIRITIGAGDAFRGTSIFYARREGVDATFAVAQAKVRPLLSAVGVK
jgi:hypothetical protein